MRKLFCSTVVLMITLACTDFIIFELWLPKKFSSFLEKRMDGGKLSFDKIELNWFNGKIIGGIWKSPQWNLTLGEGKFAYSSLDWIFGNKSQFKDLKLREFTIEKVTESDSKKRIWTYINRLREEPFDFGFDRVEAYGNFTWGTNSLPFSFFAEFPNSKKEIRTELELRIGKESSIFGELIPVNTPLFLNTFIEKDRNDQALTLSIKAKDIGGFKYRGNQEFESLEFFSSSKNKTALEFSVNRKRGESRFIGDWSSVLSSQDLVKRFPILSLLELHIDSRGVISFDSFGEEVEIDGESSVEISSSFFPNEGVVRLNAESKVALRNNKWMVEKLNAVINNSAGERIELKTLVSTADFLESGKFHLIIDNLRVGRFQKHFSDEFKINGKINGAVRNDEIILSSESLTIAENLNLEQNVSLELVLSKFSNINSVKNVNFEIKILQKIDLLSKFLPIQTSQIKSIFLQNLILVGEIVSNGWKIDSGSAEVAKLNGEKVGKLKIEKPFRLFYFENALRAVSKNRENSQVIGFSIEGIESNFSITPKGFDLNGLLKDLVGSIALQEGTATIFAKNFNLDGRLNYKGKPFFDEIILNGNLFFESKYRENDILQIKNLKLQNKNKDIIEGEILFLMDDNFQIVEIESRNLEVTFDWTKDFPKFQKFGIDKKKVQITKLNLKLNRQNELELDGLVQSFSKNGGTIFEIPFKWTYVKKEGVISHLIQLSSKKIFQSDLEINFQSDLDLISIRGKKLNAKGFINALENLLEMESHHIKVFFLSLVNKMEHQSKISIDTLTITPDLQLKDFNAEYNNQKKIISFNSLINRSSINGKISFAFSDRNSSDLPNIKFKLTGEENDATIINNVLNNQYIVDGGVRWNAEGNGGIDEEIELNMEFNFSNLIINLLTPKLGEKKLLLKDQMENSLGRVFSWSPTQTKILDSFGALLQWINIDEGSLKIMKPRGGNWIFFLEKWTGAEISFFARGEVNQKGLWKVNLFPSVKGKWVGVLEVINVLSAGKVGEGYRTLKNEPLVFEGYADKWNFGNWWRLFAEGLGLEPVE